jgi:glycosyltransferase involved in cell wall biosynthesis
MKRRLTLCFVGPAASINLRRWVEWFGQKGHDCTVLTVEPMLPNPTGSWRQIDLSGTPIGGKIGRLVSARRLASTVARLDADVVHVHYLRGLAWVLAAGCPRPCVVTPWGSDVLQEQGAFREWYSKALTRRLLSQADLVTVHSAYMETAVRSLAPGLGTVLRVGWGVDMKRFRTGLDSVALRRSLNLGLDDPVIFSPRLAQPLYNHELLIRAMPDVLRVVPQACAVFTEHTADVRYIARLRKLADDLHVVKQIRFVGELSYADMPRWYNLSAAVVMMPASDGMPSSLLEAMACGAVPVLTDLPQYDELVSDRINGRRVEHNPKALAAALVEVLQDEIFRRRCSLENRRLMESIGDQDREMEKMEALYYRLAGAMQRPHAQGAGACAQ